MSARTKRIEEPQNVVAGLKELARPFLRSISEAEVEIERLQQGFEDGERVQVTMLCQHGCCVERQFEGVVEGTTPNGCYNVRCPDGSLETYVWRAQMKRV